MDSALVIKVKYGDTLRRFSAHVDENNQLDLDMIGLRAKICSIFNFTADANLILRYVDEDGDLVTLVDNEDLRDVMRQQLKYLKIDVHVSNDIGGQSNTGSSGSATPSKSPPVLNSFLVRDSLVPYPLPEPVREALSKLSLPKAASSSPVVANLAEAIPKMGQAVLNSLFQPHNAAGTRPKTGVPEESISSEARGSQSPHVDSASNASVHTDSSTPLRSPVPDPFLSGNAVKVDESDGVRKPLRQFVSNVSRSNAELSANPSSRNGISEESITSEASLQPPYVNPASNASVQSDRATLLRSAAPDPFLSRNAVKVEHSVPEPVQEFWSKLLSHSRDTSAIQPGVNLADFISLVGETVLNSYWQPNVAAGPSSKNGVPEEPVTSEARGPQSPSVDLASNANQQVEAGNVIRGVTTGARVASVDLNILPCDPSSSQNTHASRDPLSSAVPGDGNMGKMSTDDSFLGKGDSSGASSSSAGPINSSTQTRALSPGAFIECPFSGTYPINSGRPTLGNLRLPSFKRSHSHTEATTGMFHKGVRCDGCGVYPITGPRFKSKVKQNYDLCNICFNEMGNETDYIRMDRPASVRVPRCVYEYPLNLPTLPPHIFKKGAISKHARQKLDSRFILDVNVIDGTMMAPSTAFTKIWRMRNNGTIVWPKGTQLVWIGGHKFSDSHSVDLEVPEDGVPVEKELDIAVDFTAPQLPGRYVSYWRMASPSGHKFGQRVWVLIQVDASLKDSFYDSSQGLNLNIPLDVNDSKGPQVIDINVQPAEDDIFLQTHNPNAPIEPGNQVVDKEPRLELEKEFPINEATFVGPAASSPATSVAPSSFSYPIIDLSETAPTVPSNQQSSTVDVPSSSMGVGGINSVEETLLKELEEMGFKQVDLNKEILRMNEYDLEQSVDDLCGVSEWDPMLEELREMGFRDNEMNKRLLKKNNGSIKRVVMDLINGE
ncbi:protein NBR1 homolog isoform X2 [Abrus precatorius]|uniref:Protein NBR1 homolog isoform X2 n=1 Tax=Abrus precatorius TaxID=3816 RepID=A0A8B8JI37_ABRPR|nr:protein NBR1 homolog isoform X2 [Abrus precatorius]